METNVQKYLLDGEKVIWQGKAEPFQLLDKPYRNIYPMIWSVSAVIGIAFIGFYIPYFFRSGSTFGQFLMAALLFVVPAFFISVDPFITKRAIENNIVYVLTDKRALCINKNKVKAMVLEQNSEIRVDKISNGCDVLYIGKDACESSAFSSRTNTVYGFHNPSKDPDVYTGMIFYGIKNGQELSKKIG